MRFQFLAAKPVALFVVLSIAQHALAEQYEQPPALHVKDVLEADLIEGTYHRVADKVINDGFLNTYQLQSDFGNWEVRSTAMLKARVSEVNAIAGLKELEESEEFQNAVDEDVDELVDGFKNITEDPAGAVEGAVSGVKKTFGVMGEAWRNRKNRDEDENVVTGVAKSISGFDKAKREYAAEFGVDPYSSNESLQGELDRIAAAATSGGLLASTAKALIPGGLGSVVSVTGISQSLNQLLVTTSPTELRIINREKLQILGIDPDLAELFIDNTMFSPTYQTYFVGALEQMKGVKGLHRLVKYAIPTDNEDLAFYRTRIVLMYAKYHNDIDKLDRFLKSGKGAVAISSKNELLLPAAVDHMVWTEILESVVETVDEIAEAEKVTGKILWTTGTMSEAAAEVIKGKGWSIKPYKKT